MKLFANYNFTKTDYKGFWLTIFFYVFIIGINIGISELIQGAVCSSIFPILFVIFFTIVTGLITLIWFVIIIYMTIRKDKNYILQLLVHLVFWTGFLLILIFR